MGLNPVIQYTIQDEYNNQYFSYVNVYYDPQDTQSPTMTLVSPIVDSTLVDVTVNIDVSFSEAVIGVDASDLYLTGPSVESAIKATPVHLGNNVWRFTVSNLVSGQLSGILALDSGSITDIAGNPLAPSVLSYSVANGIPPNTFVEPPPGSVIIEDLQLVNDDGTSDSDKNSTDPRIRGRGTGIGSARATIQLDYKGDDQVDETIMADADGKFEFLPVGLAYGPQSVRARALNWLDQRPKPMSIGPAELAVSRMLGI
jgi:hypothetical protein